MTYGEWLTIAEIKGIFADEITAAGGRVSDTFDDGTRLFTRSILPWVREVLPGDRVQGGVALKVAEESVSIHPYIFREVCTNGAIRAHALETRRVTVRERPDRVEAAFDIRAAVRGCCAEEVFAAGTEEMRSASSIRADHALNMLVLIARMSSRTGGDLRREIMDRFLQDADRTGFGVMNAVTSVARDTRDPDLRWRLEELGGGVPAVCVSPRVPVGDAAAAAIPPHDFASGSWQEDRFAPKVLLRTG